MAGNRSRPINWVTATVTFTLAVLTLFLPLKSLRMHRIFRRVPRYRRATVVHSGAYLAGTAAVDQQRAARTGRFGSSQARLASLCVGLHSPNQKSTNHRQQAADVTSYEYELIEATSGLPPLESLLRTYYTTLMAINWYLLLKHLMLGLLRVNALAPLRYLDCYLPGRFIVNGRVVELANSCACFLIIFKVGWYYSMKRKPTSDFRLTCFEFLLAGPDECARWQARCRANSGESMRERPEDGDDPDSDDAAAAAGVAQPNDHCVYHAHTHSSLFEFHNPFEQGNRAKSYGLRPNRTRESWQALARSSVKFYKYFGTFFAMLVIFFLGMVVPVIVNQRGFEYNYRYCIHYIATQRIQALRDPNHPRPGRLEAYFFNLIRPNQDELGVSAGAMFFIFGQGMVNVTKNFRLASRISKNFLQPIGPELVPMNAYHVVRSLLDLADSVIIYFQIAFALAGALYMTVILCNDVVCYCSALNTRLARLNSVLRSISSINLNVSRDYYYYTSIKFNEPKEGAVEGEAISLALQPGLQLSRRGLRLVRSDIREVQAMIADMFTMIDSYSRYISFQLLGLVLFWFGYSALVCSWIFLPGNDSPKTEWYTLHLFATIYLFALMRQFSAVKSESKILYRAIVVAMALDESSGPSKTVWTSLLKFYTPVPMYCFTVITSIELNMMFGLKLLTWLFSALIVASSFFTVYT